MSAEQQERKPTLSSQVILRSQDDKSYLVNRKTARKSQTVKKILDEMSASEITPEIKVPNVSSNELQKIIKYMEHESDDEDDEDDIVLSEWIKKFLDLDDPQLFHLINAAHQMEVKGLITAASKIVARMVMNQTPDQIRERFGIENDLINDVVNQAGDGQVENNETEEAEVTEQ